MRSWPLKYSYSVTSEEVEVFKQDELVREYLNKYDEGSVSYDEKAVGLARFFRWLKVVKHLDLTPADFLNTHLQKRLKPNIKDRRWALQLAIEFSRDNSDLKGKATNYKYGSFFLPIKGFCDYHEAPLTSANGHFRNRGKRKYSDQPFTVKLIKKALGVLKQRERAICMIQLQSGQAIKQVLVDINQQCRRIFQEIDRGAKRIRFDFPERKNNNFSYTTFISRDAIQEIQKWRPKREQILQSLNMESEFLFITDTGKPLPRKQFHNTLRTTFINHGLYKGPFSMRSHGFRKFFEQEASPPERGISKTYITYMMGHSSGKNSHGVQVSHPLDMVGGVYDAAPKVYPEVVEKEYAKLEPWINIYSSSSRQATSFSEDQQKTFSILSKVLDKYPGKAEKFEKFLLDL